MSSNQQNNWSRLCSLIRTHTFEKLYRYDNESSLESHFYDYLQLVLHWDRSLIGCQIVAPVGNRKKTRLDLCLRRDISENNIGVVIELKKPSVELSKPEIEEVCSYIKVFNASCGILTNGTTLLVYYASRNLREEPKLILRTTYDPSNQQAIKFFSLLDGQNYDESKLEDFCEELQTIEDVGTTFISQQMSDSLDDKILGLMKSYLEWADNTDTEVKYQKNYKIGWEKIRENIFDLEKLRGFSDDEYEYLVKTQLRAWIPNINSGPVLIHLYGGLLDHRKEFEDAIEHLNETDRNERFRIIEDFINSDGKWKIPGIGRAFWSEIVRCKFPDVPLINGKTDDFFMAINIQTGQTPEDKGQNIAYCYNRWIKKWNKSHGGKQISLLKMSHMEHFAKMVEGGIKYMENIFHTKVGEILEREESEED